MQTCTYTRPSLRGHSVKSETVLAITPLLALSTKSANWRFSIDLGSFTNNPGIWMTFGIMGLGVSVRKSKFAITTCFRYASRDGTEIPRVGIEDLVDKIPTQTFWVSEPHVKSDWISAMNVTDCACHCWCLRSKHPGLDKERKPLAYLLHLCHISASTCQFPHK